MRSSMIGSLQLRRRASLWVLVCALLSAPVIAAGPPAGADPLEWCEENPDACEEWCTDHPDDVACEEPDC